MMGSGMMDPAMMRMMHERMMAAAGSMASGNAPLILVVPVAGGGMRGPDGRMMGGSMHGEMMEMMEMMEGAGGSMRAHASPGGMAADQGFAAGVVTPARHLSVDDVRHFLEHRLEALGNPRLALGEIAEAGADEITAEIVTADGSLVEQLTVDRHSGAVRPVR
jgi:hypothetical protein